MEKKFNADLAAKIKEPQTAALIAVRFLANMGYDHVTYRFLGNRIEITVFEDTIEESEKTQTLLDTILEEGWTSEITERQLESGDYFSYIEYHYNIEN
jgi:hypothetical protein